MSGYFLKRPCCCSCNPYLIQAWGGVTVDTSGITALTTTSCTSPPFATSAPYLNLGWMLYNCIATTGNNLFAGVGLKWIDNITIVWNQTLCRWELGIYGKAPGLEIIWFGTRTGPGDACGSDVSERVWGVYTQTSGCSVGPATINVNYDGNIGWSYLGPTITTFSASPITITGTNTTLTVTTSGPTSPLAITTNYSSGVFNLSNAGVQYLTLIASNGPGKCHTATSTIKLTVVQTLTSIVVTPVSSPFTGSIIGDIPYYFSTQALDQFGNVMPLPAITWSVSGSGGGVILSTTPAINGTCWYQVPPTGTVGTDTITATSSGVSGTYNVSVTQPLDAIQVYPPTYSGNRMIFVGWGFTSGFSASYQPLYYTYSCLHGTITVVPIANNYSSYGESLQGGLYQAPAGSGTDAITITNGSITGTASINYG